MPFRLTHPFDLPHLPPSADLEAPALLRAVAAARVELAELKGYSAAMPNPMLLLSPAIIRESVASSEIENIHTTIESALQQELFPEAERRDADKEVLRYGDAVRWGAGQLVTLPLSSRLIVGIQHRLLPHYGPGYRTTPNQIINSVTGEPVFTPPRAASIPELLSNWEHYINTEDTITDPLLRCAIGHYQFEAIHPFGDGNGRTGRILMVLHLVQEQLLAQPTLFISGYINRHRQEYYRLLLAVSAEGQWMDFLLFMLRGFQQQARATKDTLLAVVNQLHHFKQQVRQLPKRVPLELAEHLFARPITTPQQASIATGLHYKTTSRYLGYLAEAQLLENKPVGRYQFYLNRPLLELLNQG
ncbi:Fic family protein [Hymenobacter endophyticus]|uniref:Fic/DOC family N-terminal domain-containing protein n=1 Tax=Hymenobacter endophyticus TaxID=3076335 RepID=A0ABU3TET7_9BACT|nr:Fic/DOC family N-terminal domain-containing protein [Hymenobacter endophyticus]MDU0369845.1 Fic/DOC family N-terminal domain-containing protein [Hymenobacter endophyticus]